MSDEKLPTMIYQYRIVYSEQRQKLKIQHRIFFLFWIDVEDSEEFDTKEEAIEALKSYRANDWKEIE